MTWALLLSAGIEPQGNTVLQPAHFTVQTVDAGVGEVLVYIEDPEGHTEEVQWHTGEKGSPRGLGQRSPGVMGAVRVTTV